MAKLKTYKNAKKKATDLHSLAVRSVGYCEAEGYKIDCSNQLQCMHIISRRFNATRTDLRNGICGCASHHRFFTDYPREFSRFISTTWAGELYDELYELSRNKFVKKVDWQERVEFLTKVINGELTLDEARKLEGKQ